MTDILMHKFLFIPGDYGDVDDPSTMFRGGKFLVTKARKIMNDNEYLLFVITDVKYPHATSVTNGIDAIANHVLKMCEVSVDRVGKDVFFVEHYDDQETYDLVVQEKGHKETLGFEFNKYFSYAVKWETLDTTGYDASVLADKILDEVLEYRTVDILKTASEPRFLC